MRGRPHPHLLHRIAHTPLLLHREELFSTVSCAHGARADGAREGPKREKKQRAERAEEETSGREGAAREARRERARREERGASGRARARRGARAGAARAGARLELQHKVEHEDDVRNDGRAAHHVPDFLAHDERVRELARAHVDPRARVARRLAQHRGVERELRGQRDVSLRIVTLQIFECRALQRPVGLQRVRDARPADAIVVARRVAEDDADVDGRGVIVEPLAHLARGRETDRAARRADRGQARVREHVRDDFLRVIAERAAGRGVGRVREHVARAGAAARGRVTRPERAGAAVDELATSCALMFTFMLIATSIRRTSTRKTMPMHSCVAVETCERRWSFTFFAASSFVCCAITPRLAIGVPASQPGCCSGWTGALAMAGVNNVRSKRRSVSAVQFALEAGNANPRANRPNFKILRRQKLHKKRR